MIHDRRAVEFAEMHAVAQERARLLELTNDALRKLTLEADRRKELIDLATAESETLRAEVDVLRLGITERNERIAILEAIAEERLAGMNENQAAAEERLELIESLRATIAMKDAELADREGLVAEVRGIAEERLHGMHELDAALTLIRAEAEKRATLLAEMSEVLDKQDREIARLRDDVR